MTLPEELSRTQLKKANIAHYRASCEGKIQYRDSDKAWEAVRNSKADPHWHRIKKEGVLMPYECVYCAQWHIGHNRNLPTNPYIEYLREQARKR